MVQIACPCPPTADGEPRHESDEVTLRATLGFRQAEAIRNEIAVTRSSLGEGEEDLAIGDILAILTEGYVLYGIESWTLSDDAGPVPVTRTNIRRFILDRWDIAPDVADAADEAYSSAVMLPLLQRASTSSRPTPTDASTSPSPPSPTPRPKPSKPSSISTIPTDATVKTTSSLDGGSNSSQSSITAA